MAGLLGDTDDRKRIAAGGQAMAASLDWSEIGRRYDGLFRRLQDA